MTTKNSNLVKEGDEFELYGVKIKANSAVPKDEIWVVSVGKFKVKEGDKVKPKHKTLRSVFYGVRQRCNNPKWTKHELYYDKGIKCEWANFEEFEKDMNTSFVEHIKTYGERNTTIDRIDSNGNYSKSNCRWATYQLQGKNKANNRWIEINGVTKTLRDWAKFMGINENTLYNRISMSGWNPIKAITTPVVRNKKSFSKANMTREQIKDWFVPPTDLLEQTEGEK